jgi:hypothetical protein
VGMSKTRICNPANFHYLQLLRHSTKRTSSRFSGLFQSLKFCLTLP